MKKQLEEIKRQEELKKEQQLIKEFDVKDKYRLDFINKVKNPLYKFTKFTGVNLNMHSNSKYNSCNKRLEYSKDLKDREHKEEMNQQTSYFRELVNRNTEIMNLKLKGKYKYLNFSVNINNNLEPFNKKTFFKNLNNIDRNEFNKTLVKKIDKEKVTYPLMKKVIYSIIELMEDMYNYQFENDKEIIELEDFQKF